MSYRNQTAQTDPFTRGALSSRVVSRLSDATARQLGYWHSTGLLAATVTPGRRGVPRLYSWVDYSKARAAVKLLRMGLPSGRLRANIEWLEVNVSDWYEIPLTAFAGNVILPAAGDDAAYTAGEIRQRVAASLIDAAPLRPTAVAPGMLADVLGAIRAEGPLGVLAEYRDVVDMDPRIRGGTPIVRGSRIETGLLAAMRDREFDTNAIAVRFALGTRQVERALEFELAVAA